MPTQKVLNKIVTKIDGVSYVYKIGSVDGYLNPADGLFYEEPTYETPILGTDEMIYVDLPTNHLYRYDATDPTPAFVQIGGSGSGLEYVDTLPSPPNIKDAIYGYYSTDSYSKTVAQDFLDENEFFTKTGDDYTPREGIDLTVSDDDTTYKTLVSLVLSGSDYEATYDDSTIHTFTDGDIFYFKVGSMKFYAGDEENQIFYILTGTNSGGGGTTYYAGTGINITDSIISAAPASTTDIGGVKPDNSTIVIDANGTISGNYQAGHGIFISENEISDKTFVGTSAEWDALTSEQKAKYIFVIRTDDYGPIEVNPGHTILNNSGTEMVQRGFLQFGNELQVTDDSTNRITKVNTIPYTAGTGISITGHEISATGGGGGGLNNLIDGEATESLVGNDTTNNKATGERATALGINTTASGSGSIAEGYYTIASGNSGSHAEGSNTSASGNFSHAEGGGTRASGMCSHAEGTNARASGMASHAEGLMTTANGRYSHAEGYQTLATGEDAHAEGLVTTASGENSHAEGYGTIAQGKHQHVSGQYNIADTSDTYALIIGNGSNDNGNITTSNALTLDWDGNLKATSYANFSSRKYKENIQDMTDEEALKLLELNPVTFDYKSSTLPNNQCGFIAEDVEKVITYPIIYENNEPDSIDYAKFVPALIKLVQIQQKQIDELRAAASSDTNLD